MVADALVLTPEWRGCPSFDWRMIRNVMRGALVMGGHDVLVGALLFMLGFASVDIGRMSAAFAYVNNLLDLLGIVKAHTVAD